MTENHLAIVLRSADYKDNDKMLTLLTPEKGKVSALARGIRKQGSSLFGTADVFSCTEFGFYIKKERYIVTQAVLKNSFYNIRNDFNVLVTASAIVEICELASTEEEENLRLFALLASALFALDNNKNCAEVFMFFVIKLLDILGVRPEIHNCVICGKPAVGKINIYKGGAVCESCPGEIVDKKMIEDISLILSTPSKMMKETDLDINEHELEILASWVSEILYKVPKSLKIMINTLKSEL